MSLTLRAAAESDRGKIRENNEDAVYAGAHLVAVADGVGGGPSGEVASEIVVKSLAAMDAAPPPAALVDAVAAANERIRQAIAEKPELEGMGTTLTALLVRGDRMELAHIGDSRAYRWRDGSLTQLSRDDTFVQGLVDQGLISTVEARNHPQRSLVTQAMHGAGMEPTYLSVEPAQGDRFLLCSDGLTDYVEMDPIARALAEHVDPARCAQELVQLALAAGAPDNVTVVVAVPEV